VKKNNPVKSRGYVELPSLMGGNNRRVLPIYGLRSFAEFILERSEGLRITDCGAAAPGQNLNICYILCLNFNHFKEKVFSFCTKINSYLKNFFKTQHKKIF